MDPNNLTPYILTVIGLLSGVVAWLFRQAIQTGKDVVKLQTAFDYYIERRTKDAAVLFDNPSSPTPRIQELLSLFRQGKLDIEGREELIAHLEGVAATPNPKRGIAQQLLTGLRTKNLMTRRPRKGILQWILPR